MQSIPHASARLTRNALHAHPASRAWAPVPRWRGNARRHVAAAPAATGPGPAEDGARLPLVDPAHIASPRTQLAREAAAANCDVDADLWEVRAHWRRPTRPLRRSSPALRCTAWVTQVSAKHAGVLHKRLPAATNTLCDCTGAGHLRGCRA